jgi:hypothetical protein
MANPTYPVDEIFGFVGEVAMVRKVVNLLPRFPDRVPVILAPKRNLKT